MCPMVDQWTWLTTDALWHIDGLMQERCNSSALALELRLSCNNPSTVYSVNNDSKSVVITFIMDLPLYAYIVVVSKLKFVTQKTSF